MILGQNKKRVVTSSLSIRFYRKDGWTWDGLGRYLLSGRLVDTSLPPHNDKFEESYFIPGAHSKLDIDRLYQNEVSFVERTFNDRPLISDLDFLKCFGW